MTLVWFNRPPTLKILCELINRFNLKRLLFLFTRLYLIECNSALNESYYFYKLIVKFLQFMNWQRRNQPVLIVWSQIMFHFRITCKSLIEGNNAHEERLFRKLIKKIKLINWCSSFVSAIRIAFLSGNSTHDRKNLQKASCFHLISVKLS